MQSDLCCKSHVPNCGCVNVQSMIELSRTQDEEVGDGTTSVIVLGMGIFL